MGGASQTRWARYKNLRILVLPQALLLAFTPYVIPAGDTYVRIAVIALAFTIGAVLIVKDPPAKPRNQG